MGINIRFLILQIFQLGVFFCRGVTHLLLGSAAFQPGLSARAVRGAARARPHRRRCRRLEEGAEIQMRRRSEFNPTQSRICKIEFYIYTVLFLSHCLSRIHVLYGVTHKQVLLSISSDLTSEALLILHCSQ